jgi:Caspase domain
MVGIVRTAIGLIVWILLTTAAQAEKRIALLIGNQGYGGEIGRLANPHNDVALLEKSLTGLGFEVAIERDAGLGTLTRAVNALRLTKTGSRAGTGEGLRASGAGERHADRLCHGGGGISFRRGHGCGPICQSIGG